MQDINTLDFDAEAIALAKAHGYEDGLEYGRVSMAYETAADYIREAYTEAYREGKKERRRLQDDAFPEDEGETLASWAQRVYGITVDDIWPDEGDEQEIAA